MTNKTSLLKLPNISRSAFNIGVVLLFSLGFVFFIQQILESPRFDALKYLELAQQVNSNGIASIKEPIRTFAYIWILSLVSKISYFLNLPINLLIFLTQLFTYYLAIIVVSNVVNSHSRILSSTIYVLLCANIFVIPYSGITLTDSFYTSICLFLFGGMMWIEFLQKSEQFISTKWIFWGVLLLSLAITIRPAAVWLLLPISFCLVRLLWNKSINIFDVLLAILLGAIPLYIQIVLNVINYKVISFLPVTDLGSFQIKWGIENIKYATWLGGGNPQNFYSSAALINIPTQDFTLWWYFNNLIDAVKLLIVKLIGAFDFDYLMPYPYYRSNQWFLSFFSFTIFWLGLCGIIIHLFTNKLKLLGSRYMPLIIFIGWCSVSLISALELRFTLPLISYFIIVASVVMYFAIVERNKTVLLFIGAGWIICMPVFYQISHFIRLQSTIQG